MIFENCSKPHRAAICFGLAALLLILACPASILGQGSHNITAASLSVFQNDTENTANSVAVTATVSINDFRIRSGSNRGDYNVQIGPGFSDDVESGVLMSCVAQNGRDNGETNFPGVNFCSSTIDYSRSGANAGAYYISTFNSPTGAEYNIDVAAAFFPYSNWLGGYARNSGDTNGGANDLFSGSPGLVLGTHFIDNGGGISTVDLRSLGIDSRTSGVLLVTGGKNEDNYAMSSVNTNNGTWTVYIKDNGTDAGSYEQDPVAFVFIPKTNITVISGRFRGDGTLLMFSGSTPQFTVTNLATGNWRLTIPGYSPANAVLMISAEGGTSQNQDNIISYQPDGDGWLIQSRDLPQSPPTLQTPGGGLEAVASFVFIPSTAAVNLISPPDNAQDIGTSPNLQVSVSNAAPGNTTIKFYGRIGGANPRTDFTIVALPDTQNYTASLHGGVPGMFIAQAEWIVTNRVSRNIAYVAHLGDIVNYGDIWNGPNTLEWGNATNAMYRVENPARTLLAQGVPYGMAVGNHDQEPNGDPNGTTTFYNQYFGISHFNGHSYYAGQYGSNNDNHFDFFSAGGMDFVVVYFEYDTNANPAVLSWANDVVRTNGNRRAIAVTHYAGTPKTPSAFSAQGRAIYDILKTNANFFLMLGGHVNGEGSRVDTYNGHTVHTLISDYQFRTNGGNGEMRVMEFSPSNNLVVVQSYSPWTGEYETDSDSEFWFNYDMQQSSGTNGAPFNLIGTITNVPAGNIASLPWPGRQYATPYEWYVVVTDASGNTITSPTWRFTTAPNVGPIASNQVITVFGDDATNLTLAAFDLNGDPLIYRTNSLPLHGLNQNFNPNAGTLTYCPVRGYRGFDRFTYSATDSYATSSIVTMNLNVVAPIDANGNGLPDSWEEMYGVSNPNADDDGDGRSNFEEYFDGTNPTNAASFFRISGEIRDSFGHVTLAWSSVGGVRYRVQYVNGSGFAGGFMDIARPLNLEVDPAPYGAPSTQTFVDDFTLTSVPTNGTRYYRIKIVQ